MAGVVLETLSTKKLYVFVCALLLGLAIFFLLGGLIAPAPYGTIQSTPILCVDKSGVASQTLKNKAFIPRGPGSCDFVVDLNDKRIEEEHIEANDIVFSQWLPLPRDNMQLRMSRWFQMMNTVIDLRIKHNSLNPISDGTKPEVQFHATLFVRNAMDNETDWKVYAAAKVDRRLECTETHKHELYDCELLPLFELGSVFYHYYLINIRIPVNQKLNANRNIGQIEDINFIVNSKCSFQMQYSCQHGLVYATCYLKIAVEAFRPLDCHTPWHCYEVCKVPMEWLTLWVDVPGTLVVSDVREGAFYAMMLSFWLIFVGEHILDQVERDRLGAYWKHLTAVLIGCAALLLFDMCERGVQLSNPFYSIWASDTGAKVAFAFIVLAAVAACLYVVFLAYMIFCVFRNIRLKSSSISQLSSARRKAYLGIVFRFKFLMMVTLLCAVLTVTFFIVSQISEGQWKWDHSKKRLEYSSAFLTGVYGMWNMYTVGLLCLYAPSHKISGTAESLSGTQEEEIQLTQVPADYSVLTSMISKTTID